MMVMAAMPYHVILSRQVTLDVPVMLFDTLFVWCVFEFVNQEGQHAHGVAHDLDHIG